MFPVFTFFISFAIILGMVVYRVDEIRLENNPEEIRKQLPRLKLFTVVRRGADTVVYVVGIRIYRLIRKIRKTFRKK